MKKLVKMGAMLGVLAVLLIGYGVVSSLQTGQSVSETAGTFALHDLTQETLAGMAWEMDGSAYAFDRADGQWVSRTEAFPVNQTAVQNIADKVLALTADREIAQVENRADYGLEEPEFSVTLTGTDGSEVVCALGDETPFGDGYYVSVSGKEAIYTLETELSSLFDKSLTQLCQMETLPELDSVTRITISGAIDALYDEGEGVWRDSVTQETLGESKIKALADDIKALAFSAVADASATEEELAVYGLGEAQALIVTAQGGEDEAFEIWLGTADETGDRYARLPGSTMVYTVDDMGVSDLLNAGMDTLWDDVPFKMAYEDMQTATFACAGAEIEITGGEPEEEADSEPEEEADDAAHALWEKLTALRGTARVESTAQGDPILSFACTGTDGTAQSVQIHPYDVDSYFIAVTGTHGILVPAADVDTMVRMLKNL